jgi:biotin synthase
LGLGETDKDRVGLIWEVAKYVQALPFVYGNSSFDSMPEHPESFPVNALVPIPGTPLEANEVGIWPLHYNYWLT